MINNEVLHMTISTQKNGLFTSAFSVNRERFRAGGFNSDSEAQIWELQARSDLKNGKKITYPQVASNATTMQDMSLSYWLDRTYRMFWADNAGPEKARHKMAEIILYFGAKRNINDLTTDLIDVWITSLKAKGNANGTINRKLATISKTLKYADELVQLKRKPVIHRQREPEGRIRFVTPEEELKIMDTLDHWSLPDLKDSIAVLIDTGLRRSELCRLTKADVSGGMLNLWKTKSGKARSIPMTARVKEVIYRRSVTATAAKLFPVQPETLSDHWDRVRYHLELDDVVLHCFRHTTASRLVQRGVSLATVQQWMGHKTITTTLRYAHLSPKNLTDALAVLEA
jgi:integrase